MPGILGGQVDAADFEAMATPMHHEQWYRCDRVLTGDVELGVVHHGDRDSASDLHWQGSDAAGVLHGVLTAHPFDYLSPERLFRAILDTPAETLANLDGLFSVACANEDRLVVATDKQGTRPCYYTTDGTLRFSSELKSLVPVLSNPSVDPQALSDLLLFEYVWGETTLLKDVSELRPAHVLTVEGGTRSLEQYWNPGYTLQPVGGYSTKIQGEYSRSVESVAATIEGRTGVWLSGGLDSRILVSLLDEIDHPFRAMTYAIPRTQELGPSTQIANILHVDHDRITLGPPADFTSHLDRAISIADGMISWSAFVNIVHIFTTLASVADVTFEAAPQDTYLGHDLWDIDRKKLASESPVDRLFHRFGKRDPTEVNRLLNDGVADPLAPLRAEVATAPGEEPEDVFRHGVWSALAYSHFRSSNVMRSQVGTRVPCVSSGFLQTAAQRPAEYNRRSVPFTDGRVPMATTQLKFEFVQNMNEQLADVPYELSGLPASYPQWAHVLGMGLRELPKKLKESTTDKMAMFADWYRNDPALNSRLNALLDDAAARPEFNAAAVHSLQYEHLSGRENNMDAIAAITTAESWRQQHLD